MPQWDIHVDEKVTGLLADAVKLHRAQISGGFMTSLGDRFLLEVFRNIARSRHGVALVATEKGSRAVVGFLLGATHTRRLFRDFLRVHGVKATLVAFPRLLRPSVLWKALETLRYPAVKSDFHAPESELLDFAVAESAQGSGLAQELFRRFAEEMEARGCSGFRITSGGDMPRAHRFYEKQGARRVGTIQIHRGEATLVFVYENERPTSPAGTPSTDA